MPRKSYLTEEERKLHAKESRKNWVEKNREKINQKHREWYEKNKERHSQYVKNRLARMTDDERKAYYKERYEKDKELLKTNAKRKEDRNERCKLYYQEHKEEIKQKRLDRLAKMTPEELELVRANRKKYPRTHEENN